MIQCDKSKDRPKDGLEAGKLKKIKKRASKGMVVTNKQYLESLAYNVTWAKSAISVRGDKTREKSPHDLNAEDVQNCLLSVLTDREPSKFFYMANKAFIRQVVFLNFTEYSDEIHSELVFPSAQQHGKPVVVRVSKQTYKTTSLQYEALRVPIQGGIIGSTDSSAPTSLAGYLVPPGMMNLLGYPMVCSDTRGSSGVTSAIGEAGTEAGEAKEAEQTSIACTRAITAAVPNTREHSDSVTHAMCGDGSPAVKRAKVDHAEEAENPSTLNPLTAPPSLVPPVLSFTCGDTSKGGAGVLQGCVPRADEAAALLGKLRPVRVRRGSQVLPQAFYRTEEAMSLTVGSGGSSSPKDRSVHDVLAIDCEMCDTVHGLELTRFSCVDGQGRVLLDTLVRPDDDIVNYRSEFSGMNKEVLAGVTVTLAQVQAAFMRMLGAQTLVVGHSLENDLVALRLVHLRCVDTAYIYPHPRGPPWRRKLKLLAEDHLRSRIQQGETALPGDDAARSRTAPLGHDSIEDAVAALKLAKLKVAKGPDYAVKKGSVPKESLLATFERAMEEVGAPMPQATFFVPSEYDSHGVRGCVQGSSARIETCDGNTQVVERALRRLKGDEGARRDCPDTAPLFMYMGISLAPRHPGTPERVETEGAVDAAEATRATSDPSDPSTDVAGTLAAVRRGIADCAVNTLLVVGAQRDLRPARDLAKQRTACMDPAATLSWRSDQEEALKNEVRRSNLAKLSLTVMNCPAASEEGEGKDEEEASVAQDVQEK